MSLPTTPTLLALSLLATLTTSTPLLSLSTLPRGAITTAPSLPTVASTGTAFSPAPTYPGGPNSPIYPLQNTTSNLPTGTGSLATATPLPTDAAALADAQYSSFVSAWLSSWYPAVSEPPEWCEDDEGTTTSSGVSATSTSTAVDTSTMVETSMTQVSSSTAIGTPGSTQVPGGGAGVGNSGSVQCDGSQFVICSEDGTAYGLCNYGVALMQRVAPGTRCVDGVIGWA